MTSETDELRPEGVKTVRKSKTGTGGAASALSEKAPEKGAGGETADEIIIRVVKAAGKEVSLADIMFEISKDEIYGQYLKREPKGLSRKVGGVAKRGLIKKAGKDRYAAA